MFYPYGVAGALLLEVVDIDQRQIPADCGEEIGGLRFKIAAAQNEPAQVGENVTSMCR